MFTPFIAILIVTSLANAAENETKVAVLEYLFQNTTPCPSILCTRQEILLKLQVNLDAYRFYARQAANQGVKLIVFPEDGIHGLGYSRQTIEPVLENIPDPTKILDWIPCENPSRFTRAEVQVVLSCMARENRIFIMANMGHIVPCNKFDRSCPSDGAHYYNTEVAYGPDGKFLARYHKRHLYLNESLYYEPAPVTEYVYVDTGLPGVGRVGLMICFDSKFPDPAYTLLHQYHIQTFVLSVAWWNHLPSFCTLTEHSSMAWAYGVNVLVSNVRDPHMGLMRTGSGIYTPQGPAAYHIDVSGGSVSSLVVHPVRLPSPSHPPISWGQYATLAMINVSVSTDTFHGYYHEGMFTWALLPTDKDTGTVAVCQKSFCCIVTYRFGVMDPDEMYALGTYYDYAGSATTVPKRSDTCTVLRCASNKRVTCGEQVISSNSTFADMSLSGTFRTTYNVFPQMLLNEVVPAVQPQHYYITGDGRLQLADASLRIISVTLDGRLK